MSNAIDHLREDYEKTPRSIDGRLKPLTRIEIEERKPFPTVKLVVVTVAIGVAGYLGAEAVEMHPFIGFFLALPIMMGVGIAIAQSASPYAKTGKLLTTAPMVLGRVVRAENKLHKPGEEPGQAVVVFSLNPERRFDVLSLKDVVKRVRSAAEAKDPPTELAEAVALMQGEGPPVKLPASVGGDEQTWLSRVEVDPRRLDENKITNHTVPLLVTPEERLVAHL